MTREEFIVRVAEVEAAEMQQPEAWWYLSFATEGAFLGGALVRAYGISTALIVLASTPAGKCWRCKHRPTL